MDEPQGAGSRAVYLHLPELLFLRLISVVYLTQVTCAGLTSHLVSSFEKKISLVQFKNHLQQLVTYDKFCQPNFMDPLSLTCNIAAVLTVTAQLISAGYSYGSSVAAFPGEVQELMAELTSLSGILSALRAIVDQPHDSADVQPSLIAKFLSSPLEECGKRLQSVLQSLQDQNEGNKMKKLFKRVTWPLKEEETKDLLAGLERYKKTFLLALSADEM